MMECFQFFNFIIILKDSIKLCGQNWRLMALVATLSMISSSIFFFIFSASSTALVLHDLLVKESVIPIFSSVISKIISDATGVTSNLPPGFVPLYFLITFLSITATVTVSTHSCNGNRLSLKELSTSIVKSWTRPFVTAFYTTVSVVGYEALALYMAIPLLTSSLVSSNVSSRAAAVVYGIAACGLYLYVCGVWIMSLVVSVAEEDGGIAAIGKAAMMMKGRRWDAFLLNVWMNFVVLVGLIAVLGSGGGEIWLVNICCLIRILTFVAYTVLYFGGKELGVGEEVELDVEYAKLSITPLVQLYSGIQR
ncbi:uncharacterized protein LOC131005020 [Salvia miltiorrhiza]|uniref:uncharacterized protein LOC131005020 n=1 Tax=Salvia miltiorrhiza TaxID=226208 RepID=UPI0025AB95CB|nr:uncharacterized protein LOC131005020 [Salvia miltiorrhiza]